MGLELPKDFGKRWVISPHWCLIRRFRKFCNLTKNFVWKFRLYDQKTSFQQFEFLGVSAHQIFWQLLELRTRYFPFLPNHQICSYFYLETKGFETFFWRRRAFLVNAFGPQGGAKLHEIHLGEGLDLQFQFLRMKCQGISPDIYWLW